MGIGDHWNRLRFGTETQVKEALRQIQDAYDRDQDASHIMELGSAYLWIRQYETAWEHFDLAIQRDPAPGSDFYGMAGVAKWCMGEHQAAVGAWVRGLDAEFADTAGLGIRLPLLLFFSAVVRPTVYEKHSAELLLTEKTRDPRITEWPGPIAKWLLGQITKNDFHGQCSGADASDTCDRRWLAEFYQGITQLAEGRRHDFVKTMRKLASISGPEWSDETFFLARMWGEEFFLARHEARLSSTRQPEHR